MMGKEIEIKIESAIERLYANGQYKLKQICNKEMMRFGGISQKDHDCFYSRAGLEISVAMKNNRYDPTKGENPMDFLVGIIKQSVLKEMTDRNRGKRQNFIEIEEVDKEGNVIKKKQFVPTISIDAPVDEENGITIKDTLQSDFDMGKELSEDFKDGRIENFLNGLSI